MEMFDLCDFHMNKWWWWSQVDIFSLNFSWCISKYTRVFFSVYRHTYNSMRKRKVPSFCGPLKKKNEKVEVSLNNNNKKNFIQSGSWSCFSFSFKYRIVDDDSNLAKKIIWFLEIHRLIHFFFLLAIWNQKNQDVEKTFIRNLLVDTKNFCFIIIVVITFH